MCGIAGILDLDRGKVSGLENSLGVFNSIQKHRGPDDSNIWIHKDRHLGFAHRRLSIIDVDDGAQPMVGGNKNCITFNGEIYNYIELRDEFSGDNFKTNSDTEVILKSYEKWGSGCLDRFRGMFSFALWDEKKETLFCARDFFGIKPFYYTVIDNKFYFASEVKALLPFVKDIETDLEAFKEYLSFQFVLSEKTLFKNIKQLLPGHFLVVKNGKIKVKKYWEVYYDLDFNHTSKYFEKELQVLLEDSIRLHTRSDVPIGGYLSGGLDSSVVCALANKYSDGDFAAFTGKFSDGEKYEGEYKDGEYDGQGTLTLLNGDMYEGEFKDGKYDGQGTWTYYNGDKYVGEWKKGVVI